MSAALITARRGMPERQERAARRARFALGGDAARGSRVICRICNGVVEDRTYVRVVCSCCLHRRCTLGFLEDSAHAKNGSTTITCLNPASHSARQRITLGPLVAQIRNTLNASSLADRRKRALKALSGGDHGGGSGRLDTSRNDVGGGGGGRGRARCVFSATELENTM